MTGMVLGHRYKLLEEIGQGGMAIIYKAHCMLLNRNVAVKVLKPELNKDKEFLKRFENESQAAAKLSHPNVVSIYDVGEENDIRYIVMEYVEGITLKEYIKKYGPLKWKEAIDCASQICSALDAAHRVGIVHKDIKSQNVILTEDGTAKVTDFGIARAINSDTIALGDTTMGSVHYFSPEQAKGSVVDARSDLYSLGIVMYEMLTGCLPFDGDTAVSIAMKQIGAEPTAPRVHNPEIPSIIENVVLKLLRKDKERRYQNAAELMYDLKRGYLYPEDDFLETPQPQEEVPAPVSDDTKKMPVISDVKPVKEPNTEDDQALKSAKSDKKKPVTPPSKTTQTATKTKKNGKGKMKKEDKVAIIAAAATAFVIILICSIFLYKVLYPKVEVNTVSIPSVIGMTVDEAKDAVKGKDIKISIKEQQYSKDYKEGEIISQTPEKGNTVELPATIEVVVSKGIDRFKLLSFVGKDIDDVVDELQKSGLMYTINYEKSSKADGTILDQDPPAGETVETGDVITLTVAGSIDDDEKTGTVPKVEGMSLEAAKAALESAGLKVGDIIYTNSDKEFETVIKQSLAEGTKVLEGTKIDLFVSSDNQEETPTPEPETTPEPSTEPSVTPAPATQAPTQAPTPAPTTKNKDILIRLPQTEETVSLRVVADGTPAYVGTVSTAEGSVYITVPVKIGGTTNVEVYINGNLYNTQSVQG